MIKISSGEATLAKKYTKVAPTSVPLDSPPVVDVLMQNINTRLIKPTTSGKPPKASYRNLKSNHTEGQFVTSNLVK